MDFSWAMNSNEALKNPLNCTMNPDSQINGIFTALKKPLKGIITIGQILMVYSWVSLNFTIFNGL